MKINAQTKINDLIENYPFLIDFLADYNPKFSIIRSKAMRATLGRMANLQMVSTMGAIDLTKLLNDLKTKMIKPGRRPIKT